MFCFGSSYTEVLVARHKIIVHTSEMFYFCNRGYMDCSKESILMRVIFFFFLNFWQHFSFLHFCLSPSLFGGVGMRRVPTCQWEHCCVTFFVSVCLTCSNAFLSLDYSRDLQQKCFLLFRQPVYLAHNCCAV